MLPALAGLFGAEALAQSAARVYELARLLDPDTPVPGITEETLPPEIAAIAVPATTDESTALGDALPALAETTFDVYLNAGTFRRNVPAALRDSRLGGY